MAVSIPAALLLLCVYLRRKRKDDDESSIEERRPSLDKDAKAAARASTTFVRGASRGKDLEFIAVDDEQSGLDLPGLERRRQLYGGGDGPRHSVGEARQLPPPSQSRAGEWGTSTRATLEA